MNDQQKECSQCNILSENPITVRYNNRTDDDSLERFFCGVQCLAKYHDYALRTEYHDKSEHQKQLKEIKQITKNIKRIAKVGFEDLEETRAIIGGCDLINMLCYDLQVIPKKQNTSEKLNKTLLDLTRDEE